MAAPSKRYGSGLGSPIREPILIPRKETPVPESPNAGDFSSSSPNGVSAQKKAPRGTDSAPKHWFITQPRMVFICIPYPRTVLVIFLIIFY